MKTNAKNKLTANGFEGKTARTIFIQNRRLKNQNRAAFTLVELLVVISIIAVLAALVFPVLGSLKRREYISKTQAELSQLKTAIDSYKATYGFYPLGNTNDFLINPLYFELVGTMLTNSGTLYITLDSSAQINANDVPIAFPGVDGFINCTKPGAVEDTAAAKDFLSNLKPNQFTTKFTNNGVEVAILLSSVGGPDVNYNPLNQLKPPYLNPWRYIYPGINNPGSYDLWVELKIGGRSNLVCNWSKQIDTSGRLP